MYSGLQTDPKLTTTVRSPPGGLGPPPSRPLTRKRPHRRSPQACDECRLRKRACDAVEPCRPCQRAGLKCTYQFRRPVPPPTLRIRELQDHLSLAHKWLQHVKDTVPADSLPGLDLDECLRTLDFTQPNPNEAPSPTTTAPTPAATTTAATPTMSNSGTPTPSPAKGGSELQTRNVTSSERQSPSGMLAGFDRKVTLPSGETCFYGAFSDVSFAVRTIELFRQGPVPNEIREFDSIRRTFAKPTYRGHEAMALQMQLYDETFGSSDASLRAQHLMLSFIPRHRLEDLAGESALSDGSPLPQVYLALQNLIDCWKHRTVGCQAVRDQAHSILHKGLGLLLPIDQDSLTSLQALLCAVNFMLTSGRITAAHSLISNACSLARRMGLFAKENTAIDSPRQIEHVQALAVLMALDLLISLILDIPPCIPRDAIEETYISQLARDFESQHDLRTAATLRQVCLLLVPRSIRDRTQRAPAADGKESDAVMEDIRLLETAHAGFRRWKRDVSSLLTSMEPTDEEQIVTKDLETLYNFCQIIVFRSHLHHLRSVAVGGSMSKAQSYHALACLKIATSTIGHVDRLTDTTQLSTLADSWLGIYTIFSAVMCLIFLIAAHPGTARPSVAWQRAHKGIRILAACSCGDNIAAACLEVVKIVTTELSHTVYFDFQEIEASVRRVCDGENPDATPGRSSPSTSALGMDGDHAFMDNPADRMLFQADTLTAEFDFRDILNLSDSE